MISRYQNKTYLATFLIASMLILSLGWSEVSIDASENVGDNFTINLGTNEITNDYEKWSSLNGNRLFFGSLNDQVCSWRVLTDYISTQSVNEPSVLLDYDGVFYELPYNISTNANDEQLSGAANEWSGCDLNSYFDEVFMNCREGIEDEDNFLSTVEAAAVANTKLLSSTSVYETGYASLYNYESTDYVFLLSANEIMSLYQDSVDYIKQGSTWGWWTRSSNYMQPAFSGGVSIYGFISNFNVDAQLGVSPALNLTESDVLFTQAVSNNSSDFDKTQSIENSLIVNSEGKEWKTTIIDALKTIDITQGEKITIDEDGLITVPFTYQDGESQSNVTQISVFITDKDYTESNAKILYYGSLENIKAENGDASNISSIRSGYGTFTLPDDLPDGYRTYIIAEDINSGYYTDYSSAPVEIPTIKEKEPENIGVIFTDETIKVESGSELVVTFDAEDEEYTIGENGCLPISEEWLGHEICIRNKASDNRHVDSKELHLIIPDRRAAPNNVSAVDETTDGANDGKIVGLTCDMEVSLTSDGEYKRVTLEDLEAGKYDRLPASEYYVRYSASETEFISLSRLVIVKKGTAVVISTETTATTEEEIVYDAEVTTSDNVMVINLFYVIICSMGILVILIRKRSKL